MNIVSVILCFLSYGVSLVLSQWDFAVTTRNRILFYDENWFPITSAAHQFDDLSAITFDESKERIFFNDRVHNNGSIFSLRLSLDGDANHFTEQQLSKTQDESIAGIAFDPLDRILYWTDARNRKIYRLAEDKNQTPEVLFDFTTEGAIPDGISVDVCRRKLYWTNSNHQNPSVERSSLDGTKREVLIDSNLFLPHGIIVDQFSNRIYWVVEQQGIHFTVESANLDGTDRQIVAKGLNSVPFSLTVTKKSVYWTDLTHKAIWNISKESFDTVPPNKVQSFSSKPRGIIARTHFLSKLINNAECKLVIEGIKQKLLKRTPFEKLHQSKEEAHKREIFCLNQGEYNPHSGTCICKVGFTGARCELDACHNYCVHGTCNLSSMGFAECTCQEGFTGERCETFKCHNYCLNEGHCEIRNDIPICHCPDTHYGVQCEKNTTENCMLYCRIRTYDPESHIPYICYDICESYEEMSTEGGGSLHHATKPITMCKSTYNKTVIFVVIGVLVALSLVFIIIQSLKRIYKPARPRIKKTFVVQKKISQTPLTSRPVATEQCEITIENCCNMNICDTPCFDPKLLQQNMSRNKCTKEDKAVLINSMEGDLY